MRTNLARNPETGRKTIESLKSNKRKEEQGTLYREPCQSSNARLQKPCQWCSYGRHQWQRSVGKQWREANPGEKVPSDCTNTPDGRSNTWTLRSATKRKVLSHYDEQVDQRFKALFIVTCKTYPS